MMCRNDCARKSGVSLKKMRSRAYEAPSTFSFDYSVAIVYATLIVKGKKTLDQVPALIKPQVEEILKDLEVEI